VNPIVLPPTTLMRVPPLEYIDIAAKAGYDGIGLRLYPSPGMPFFPIVGDEPLMRDVKQALADSDLQVLDIFTCYLQPETDLEAMKRAHEFGAELGAKYAVVIGDDTDWSRMVDNFARLCENAAQFGIVAALETPVNRRALTTLELNLKLIGDSGREDAVLDVDPVQYFRAGHTVEMLKGVDARLMPYTQICDAQSLTPMAPYCMPGEGIFPLREMLDVMPAGLPLSLEYHYRDESYTPLQWAKHVLEGTRRFLEDYYGSIGGAGAATATRQP
jgi:sugar phosphate isomerase/epimerase